MEKILLYDRMERGAVSESAAPFLPSGGSRDQTSPHGGRRNAESRRSGSAYAPAAPEDHVTSLRPKDLLVKFFDYQTGKLIVAKYS